MQWLTFGNTDNLIVTLNEKRTLSDGYYLFVFTNIITNQVVNKIYNFAEDESGYQDRYNSFPIITSTVFAGKNTGEWRYEVYEQVSSTNTDITGLTEVERGLLKLNPATEFEYESYNGATSYKQYAG